MRMLPMLRDAGLDLKPGEDSRGFAEEIPPKEIDRESLSPRSFVDALLSFPKGMIVLHQLM